jgi:hypothetical protein
MAVVILAYRLSYALRHCRQLHRKLRIAAPSTNGRASALLDMASAIT